MRTARPIVAGIEFRATLLSPAVAAILALAVGCETESEHDPVSGGAGARESSAGVGGDPESGGDPGNAGDPGHGGTSGSAGESGAAGLAGGVTLIDCDDRSVDGATEVGGSITEDQTWEGTISITRDTTFAGDATLTIRPGTRVIMDVDTGLHINGNRTRVIAEGTPAEPIRFCGREHEAGYWGSLIVGGPQVTSDSVIRHVLIADGGGDGAAAFIQDHEITVADVVVRNSAADGVHASNFKEGSARLSVLGSDGTAVVLLDSSAVNHFPLGGVFEDNAEDAVRVRFTGIDADTTYSDPGIPYIQEERLSFSEGHGVTFAAGVEYRFAADSGMTVGWNGSDTRILVEGTEDAPVVFRGEHDGPGNWEGVEILARVAVDSVLSHLEIRDGGAGDVAPLDVGATITLDHVTLSGNARAGTIRDQGLSTTSSHLVITGSEEHALNVDAGALTTLPVDGSFTGNGLDWIAIHGGGFNGAEGTIPNPGVPFRVERSWSTTGDSVLAIAPGTEFVMTADTEIEIGWNSSACTIAARGTAEEPIIFRGAVETPGYWRGLHINGRVTSDSLFDYVEIHHGGQGTGATANLRLDARIPVTNSSFYHSAGHGILKRTTNPTDYTSTNTFANVALSAVGTN